MRKDLLVTGEIYHIFSRSIADFIIFNNSYEFLRMQQLMKYYIKNQDLRFSKFIDLKIVQNKGFNITCDLLFKDKKDLIQIITYCLMPTHIHLIIKQIVDKGITKFMKVVLDSYTRYFNTKHKRKGPLWESRFKNVLVKTDEQLLHLTRYIHLNPVTAKLVNKPENWDFSSYKEYLSNKASVASICQFDDILEIESDKYRRFVKDHISYQRELARIKSLILE